MLKYEDYLWGKVDFLHSRYHKIYSNLNHYLELMSKFQTSCLTFSKSLNTITNQNYIIYSDKNTSLFPVIGSIKKNISLHSKEFADFSDFINSKIIEQVVKSLNETYLKENNLYDNYIKSRKNFNNSKIDLEKSKNNFNDNAKICENLILNAKKVKYNVLSSKKDIEKNENLASKGMNEAVNFENKYIQYLNETNKNREDANKKELDLLNMYQDIDKEFVIKIKGMISMYIAGIKKMYSTILADITWMHNQFKKINSENDLNMFLNEYKSNFHKEEEIPFIPYNPISSLDPKSIKFSEDTEKEENILDINFEVISSLKKSLKNVCPSINMEEENKKRRLRILCSKIFNTNTEFLEEEKKELLDYVKEISFRKYFLSMLSKQRTNGRYKRSKKLIDDLSDILNLILEYCEKEKDYEGAKNCIILSQTYFYEIIKSDKKKYKFYIFNNIKKNKWITTIDFWENLIEKMISIELKNNEKNIKKFYYNEKHKKNALSNIGFGQLLPYSQNMIELGIPKESVLSVCKKFIDKCQVKKEYVDIIENNINNFSNLDFEDEVIEEDSKLKINEKNKKILTKEENENDIIEEYLPNSKFNNKSKINLISKENNFLGNNNNNIINIDNDSTKNKILINGNIDKNNMEDTKKDNQNKIIINEDNNDKKNNENNKNEIKLNN